MGWQDDLARQARAIIEDEMAAATRDAVQRSERRIRALLGGRVKESPAGAATQMRMTREEKADLERRVLELFEGQREIRKRDVAAALGVSAHQATTVLGSLVGQRVIELRGSRTTAHYVRPEAAKAARVAGPAREAPAVPREPRREPAVPPKVAKSA